MVTGFLLLKLFLYVVFVLTMFCKDSSVNGLLQIEQYHCMYSFHKIV